VFKHFPLRNHSFAIKASAAALAANAQGKFWEMHERLFQNYKNLNETKVKEIAQEMDLNWGRLEEDMNGPQIRQLIVRDLKESQEAGVRGIPTVFINGKLLKKRNLEEFQEMIDAALAKTR